MTDVRDLSPDDAPELTALYEEYEWWEDRSVDGVLTDYTYYANVFNVIVAADHRGEGVGATLVKALLTAPTSRSRKVEPRDRSG